MTWQCAAIDHGVTIFPNGKIGPCCKITADYLKPASSLADPARFADLKTTTPPAACQSCTAAEYHQVPSYRKMFNSMVTSKPGLQFVDIRNTNLCNLKCRYCGPHFSSSWARELGDPVPIVSAEVNQDLLLTDSLHWMYFTGGEPLINREHWELLQHLIDSNKSSNITLLYNTNLTTLKYKDKNITDIWKQFKKVTVNCSIDGTEQTQEFVRSGADWHTIDANIQLLKQMSVEVVLSPVISILNIWTIDQLCEYAEHNCIKMTPIVLTGPDYLALDVVPDQLQQSALAAAVPLKKHVDINVYNQITHMITNNQNQCLFKQTVSHVLLLDHLRDEKLFDLLPFREVAMQQVLENRAYD